MAVTKNILCPHCKKALSPVGGFYHDDKLNLLCSLCSQVIFAATREQEDKSKYSLTNHTVTTGYGGVDNWKKKDYLPIKSSPLCSLVDVVEKNSLAFGGLKEYSWWS
jgi:hypothetical protein